MPEGFILRLIPYAELDYGLSTDKEHSDYITYAVQKCGFELVKNEIVNLLKQNTENNQLWHIDFVGSKRCILFRKGVL